MDKLVYINGLAHRGKRMYYYSCVYYQKVKTKVGIVAIPCNLHQT